MQARLAIMVALAPLLIGRPAWASGIDSFNNDSIITSDERPGEPGWAGESGPASPGPSRQLYSYWAIGWDGDRFCRVLRSTTDAALAESYTFAFKHSLAAANALGSSAECPPNATLTAPPAAPNPGTVARDFWDVRILPVPALTIVPGYAITGKPIYLQITSDQARHFDVPDPLGPPVAIEATSDYIVDWGDGTPPETTTSRGGAWPTGTLTHSYTTTNPTQPIRVAERWSATWSAGDQRGTLDNLRTESTLTFTVTQVQAVRN